MLAAFSIAAALAAGAPAALDEGRAWKLTAKPDGEQRVCLTYAARLSTTVEPDRARTLRERLCARVKPETLRFDALLALCASAPPALFGVAGPDVVKVNVRPEDGSKVIRLRLRRLPSSLGVEGSSFVWRRSLEGSFGRITAHLADGRRVRQDYGPYPIPGCAGPPVAPEPAG